MRASIPNAPPDILLQDEILVLIDRQVIYRFVPPHNFNQFFIHDCFELHDENFQEYPGSRDMVTSRNIPERIPFKWLRPKKKKNSGLRARHFKTSASMFFFNKKKKIPIVFQLQMSM